MKNEKLSAAPAAHAGVWLACLALTACGGGNGSADSAITANPAVATPVVDSVAAPVADSVSSLAIGSRTRAEVTPPGAGYFVDAVNGSDANAGTFLKPWKSLAKLSNVALKAGEGFYLRCGSVWREPLALTNLQLVDGSIVAGYGVECNTTNKPRITGADDFSLGWTKSGSVWSKRVAAGQSKIPRVTVNGVALRTAQWPNHGGVGKEWALTAATGAPSMTAIRLSATDRALLGNNDLAGARVQIRSEPWLIEERKVSTINATDIVLGAATEHPIAAGDGYVLQDKAWMLDAPGEYFHDTVNGMLHIYPLDAVSQANLNSASVEGMVREVALGISGRANLAVSNLSADMARGDGLVVNDSPGALIDGVDASNNINAGVRVNLRTLPAQATRRLVVRNGRYLSNVGTGIDSDNALNVDIVANTIIGTGMGQVEWSNAAIVGGDGAKIERNVIEQTAFRGILFSGFGESLITGNSLSEYCVRLSDCAAIYTVNGANRVGLQSSTVEANRILGGVLNVEGTTGGHVLAGIYLDDLSRGVMVRQNILFGMPIGIYVHNSSNSTVEANRVWMTTNFALMANMDRTSADHMTGNVFRGNQLVPASSVTGAYPALPQFSSSGAIRFLHALSGPASLTAGHNVFSQNRIVAFNGDTSTVADVGFAGNTTVLSASGWMALNAGEAASASPAVYAASRPTLGDEVLTGSGFELGLGDWTTYFLSTASGASAVPVIGLTGCDQQCVRLTSSQSNDRLSSPLFRMVAGMQYLITFKAVFNGSADIAHPNIGRAETPFDSYVGGLKSSNTTLSGKAGEVIRYEGFFTAASSDPARLNMRVSTPGVPVAFDSISLRPLIGYTVSNFKDWGAVVSAPTSAAKKVECVDLGWSAGCSAIDVDGNAVAMPATLPAGTTKLLLWANSSWRL